LFVAKGNTVLASFATLVLGLVVLPAVGSGPQGKDAKTQTQLSSGLILEIQGTLNAASTKDAKNDNAPSQIYVVTCKAFSTYVIEMKADSEANAVSDAKCRPLLRLEGEGVNVVSDDNMRWNPRSESHLIFTCAKDGPYQIVATTRGGGMIDYRVTVRLLDSHLEKLGGKILSEASTKLAASDPKDIVRGTPCKEYKVDFKKGNLYDIEMRAFSRIFAPYLRLESAEGRQVKSSSSRDIAADGRVDEFGAHTTYYCREDGKFKVIATNFSGQLGDFHLMVRERTPNHREVKEKSGLEIRDQLTKGDPKDGVLKTSPSKDYWVKLQRGLTYTIELRTLKIGHNATAISFDAVLRLEDDGGRELAFNDDEEAGLVQPSSTDSRITFTCPRDGVYRIIATSLDAYYENTAKYPQAGCGVFALSVQQSPIRLDRGAVIIKGGLTADDPKDRDIKDGPSRIYALEFAAGKTYQIDLQTNAFNGFLRLEDANRRQLHFNYDITHKNKNARLIFSCETGGTYHLVVASVQGRTGEFTLTVNELKEGKQTGD